LRRADAARIAAGGRHSSRVGEADDLTGDRRGAGEAAVRLRSAV
jgi:hypothetical protein